ncbi:DUF1223 domain-containing protein [Paracoccus sediminis]|uniref:DUF1223 domain-containing protein n=1 Tax=Paracoccus sediminis TaxID=1214787 RepID=A0A238Y225_9RHOB|nr:DUF1223 domain-containing protein [Paracoccus sediminis]TBN47210.1 DUF1223 domain-containing protein [Paracoccus sediminis]SNR65167.1 hypothetical protein SAMN06265378_11424 [Paracoccus sediminis]
MLALSAALCRNPLAAALCGLALTFGGMAAAQGPEGGGIGAALNGGPRGAEGSRPGGEAAPVIAAPSDPSRSAPSSAYAPSETGGFNSFAATDGSPPMEPFAFDDAVPVVVELFTSQGCSSCPAADAMLSGLSDQPDVLPLSFHVDYWDYLGWTDSFARPEFTRRQERYAQAAGERSVYTPQMIVDGIDTAVTLGPAQLMGLIDASRVAPAMVSVQRDTAADGQSIELMPLSDLGGRVDILMVRYAPERSVEVTAGENRGKTITYTNVVLSLDRLAEWDSMAPLRMKVSAAGAADDRFPPDTRHALLVQKQERKGMPGPILAAIRLD